MEMPSCFPSWETGAELIFQEFINLFGIFIVGIFGLELI